MEALQRRLDSDAAAEPRSTPPPLSCTFKLPPPLPTLCRPARSLATVHLPDTPPPGWAAARPLWPGGPWMQRTQAVVAAAAADSAAAAAGLLRSCGDRCARRRGCRGGRCRCQSAEPAAGRRRDGAGVPEGTGLLMF
jgi:hypothetical protein